MKFYEEPEYLALVHELEEHDVEWYLYGSDLYRSALAYSGDSYTKRYDELPSYSGPFTCSLYYKKKDFENFVRSGCTPIAAVKEAWLAALLKQAAVF